MYSDILLTLKNLHYSGDHKNFTFDKLGWEIRSEFRGISQLILFRTF